MRKSWFQVDTVFGGSVAQKDVLGLGTLQRLGLRNSVQRPPVFCVGLPLILLMEEILHHLGCIKLCKEWGKLHRGVSKNRGTPKSSILVGFSIINHPIWGTPIFGNTHITWCRISSINSIVAGPILPNATAAYLSFHRINGLPNCCKWIYPWVTHTHTHSELAFLVSRVYWRYLVYNEGGALWYHSCIRDLTDSRTWSTGSTTTTTNYYKHYYIPNTYCLLGTYYLLHTRYLLPAYCLLATPYILPTPDYYYYYYDDDDDYYYY